MRRNMKRNELLRLAEQSSGHFVCELINGDGQMRRIEFQHILGDESSPELLQLLENYIGDLPELLNLYRICGELKLYWDPVSDDSAYIIGSCARWQSFHDGMMSWVGILSDTEKAELLPVWFENALVFGEIPQSGDYLLIAGDGDEKGKIYRFYHDGFEFVRFASSVGEMIEKMFTLDADHLLDIATDIRFMEMKEPYEQWWIKEYVRNDGVRVSSDA